MAFREFVIFEGSLKNLPTILQSIVSHAKVLGCCKLTRQNPTYVERSFRPSIGLFLVVCIAILTVFMTTDSMLLITGQRLESNQKRIFIPRM